MSTDRRAQAEAAFSSFLETELDSLLSEHATADPWPTLARLLQDTVREVPAYADFLRARGVDPLRIQSISDFAQLPLTTKRDYVQAYPLAARCRHGALERCDMIAVSSGSTGEPTVWPRSLRDELSVALRFEQIFHDSFEADRKRTLAVVCFPLGTWVGGLFTTACCRHLASKGYPITVVAPGNNKPEILRVVRALAASFEQVVLLGYPPFVKEVIDHGREQGIDWPSLSVRLVFAGEVFSEEWRTLVGERAGLRRPLRDSASMYGTADAGVLGVETPLSIAIRRFLSTRPGAARELFGESRLPTLLQYDPLQRFFEVHQRTLVFSGDNGVPLIRYHISDDGGLYAHDDLLARLGELGFDAHAEARRDGERGVRALPFVYVFGRSHFALSLYGANVFPEMVAIALEQPHTSPFVTGKFVMQVVAERLTVAVELAGESEQGLEDRLADAMLASLLRLNSEYHHYVPAERQRPAVTLHPQGDPGYFPVGVKHRYSRRT